MRALEINKGHSRKMVLMLLCILSYINHKTRRIINPASVLLKLNFGEYGFA
jgi:hypothetical protein